MGTTFSTAAGKGDTREPSPTNDERSAKEDPSGLRSALRKAVEGGGLQEVQVRDLGCNAAPWLSALGPCIYAIQQYSVHVGFMGN